MSEPSPTYNCVTKDDVWRKLQQIAENVTTPDIAEIRLGVDEYPEDQSLWRVSIGATRTDGNEFVVRVFVPKVGGSPGWGREVEEIFLSAARPL